MSEESNDRQEAGGPRRRTFGSLLATNSAFIFLILGALLLVFTVLQGSAFLSPENFSNIAVDASELLLLGVGLTFVIITAGIDLSVGSVLVLSSVVAAQVMVNLSGTSEQVQNYQFPNQGVGIPLGIAAGLLTGLLCGIVNGLLVTRLKMPAFIVTLGTLGMALGAAQILSGGSNVPYVPTAMQAQIGTREIFGFLPVPVLITLVVVIIAALALSLTSFGRYTYAIGSNAEAARRVGINVDRHLLKVYALSGFLAGLAGIVDVARFNTASVGAHASDNLAAISAVVIGGTSLFGGEGGVTGTLIGAVLIGVLNNGLVLLNVSPYWQPIVVGFIIVLSVFVDQLVKRRGRR